jgi:hypothetical protein
MRKDKTYIFMHRLLVVIIQIVHGAGSKGVDRFVVVSALRMRIQGNIPKGFEQHNIFGHDHVETPRKIKGEGVDIKVNHVR